MLEGLSVQLGEDGSCETVVPDGWGQGRWVFGGLIGALLVRAADSLTPDDRRLRSLTVGFVGPVTAGSVTLRARVLRAGRGVTHVRAELLQGDSPEPDQHALCAHALLTYGVSRPSSIRLPSLQAPAVPGPEGIADMPAIPGIVPEFLSNFAVRWTVDSLPFTGSEAKVQGWIRPRFPGSVDSAVLMAVIDAWPPPLLSAADRPVAVTSLVWQVALSDAFEPTAEGDRPWWLYDAAPAFGGHGYSDVEARLWDGDGMLMACSRQVYADFSGV